MITALRLHFCCSCLFVFFLFFFFSFFEIFTFPFSLVCKGNYLSIYRVTMESFTRSPALCATHIVATDLSRTTKCEWKRQECEYVCMCVRRPYPEGLCKAPGYSSTHVHILAFFPTDIRSCFMRPLVTLQSLVKPLKRGGFVHTYISTFQFFSYRCEVLLHESPDRGLCKVHLSFKGLHAPTQMALC